MFFPGGEGKDNTMASVWAVLGRAGTEKDRTGQSGHSLPDKCQVLFLWNEPWMTAKLLDPDLFETWQPSFSQYHVRNSSNLPPSSAPAPQPPQGQRSGERQREEHFGGAALIILPLLLSWENVGKTLPFYEPRSLHLCSRSRTYHHLWFLLTLLLPPATQDLWRFSQINVFHFYSRDRCTDRITGPLKGESTGRLVLEPLSLLSVALAARSQECT